jgi:hypothetical protein
LEASGIEDAGSVPATEATPGGTELS